MILRVKQRGIKKHFFSLWYDSTWDWTPVSRAISQWIRQEEMLYSHLLIHAEIYIYMLDTYWRNDKQTDASMTMTKTQEDFFNNILPLTLLQGFERVVQGLHVRGSWISNITAIFWPHCYDRHVVSFSFNRRPRAQRPLRPDVAFPTTFCL